jgi:hypothetical protein
LPLLRPKIIDWLGFQQSFSGVSMKSVILATVVFAVSVPAVAASNFLIDFEKPWIEPNVVVDNTYASSGVSFTNVLGLSNGDGLGNLPNGAYYANAPSPIGIAFAQLDGQFNTTSFMNVASGVTVGLNFYYSSPSAIANAVRAYSGLNGTGTLLGSFSISATDPSFSVWSQGTLNFSGTALSFDLTPSANIAAFDNISPVPEPHEYMLMLAGLGVVGLLAKRRKENVTGDSSSEIKSI